MNNARSEAEMELEGRTRQLEIDMGVLRHDVANLRMSITGLDSKIDKLRNSIFTMGASIIGAMFLMLISIIGYFMVQKDTQLDEMRQLAQRMEMRMPAIQAMPVQQVQQPNTTTTTTTNK